MDPQTPPPDKSSGETPLARASATPPMRTHPGPAAGDASPDPPQGLVEVQNRLMQRYFHLRRIEHRLAEEARRQQPDPGRRAIRQIELERQRLGRDLHTGVGQMLAATRLQLETIERQLPSPPPAVRQALDRILEITGLALEQVRAVSRRLHPPEWQRLSLPEALRQLWDLSGLPERADARLDISPSLPEPDLETKILLYRALQEALSNIARHSRATAVHASLDSRAGRLHLVVRDNGVGFDPPALWKAPPNLTAGIGLRAIRELAASLGGELQVHSGPDGTTLEVSVPETETA